VSLKAFHIVLISLSSVLSLLFGGWSAHAWRVSGDGVYLALAIVSFLLAAGLAIYIVWFAKKVRPLAALSVIPLTWLTASGPAEACTVCYGQAEGPMIDAARLGVYLLFALVLSIQAAFVLFFFHLHKRAKLHRQAEESSP